ncbi:YitT family protein [Mesobacillus persicus]|nr:YitT family protein [Mesobacillus persicus]
MEGVVRIFARAAALVIGSILLGIGINGFLVPHQLLDGGIIGIALILQYYFDFPAGLWSALLSIPLIIYAWVKDRNQFHGSFYGMIVTAVFIDLFAPYQFFLPIWLSAILGGAICGIGVGIMLRYKTSTGGTDLIAYFVAKATPLNIGFIIAFMDGLIVLLGYQTLGLQSVVFSTITILIAGYLASVCYERF